MMTVRQRIIDYLQNHPEGADDDTLADALRLPARQQANSVCRGLVREGLALRRPADGKIHTFLVGEQQITSLYAAILGDPKPPQPANMNGRDWFWDGNLQDDVVRYLEAQGYEEGWEPENEENEQVN